MNTLSLIGTGRRILVWMAIGCILLTSFGGCGGCRRNRPAAQKKEDKDKEEKPKEPFDTLAVGTLPYDKSLPINPVKAGHWSAARIQVRANLFDFAGQAITFPTDRGLSGLRMEMTDDLLRVGRGLALPKGQAKSAELMFYVPRNDSNGVFLRTTLRGNRGGGTELSMPAVRLMPGYQYYMVVLANEPDDYVFLKTLPSVAPPRTDWEGQGRRYDYLVVSAEQSRRGVALPSSPLAWTTVAFLVWDDFDPQRLSPAQRQSLLDWLYWGGQLLITSPRSVDGLRQTFLEPLLPAQLGPSRLMTSEDLEPLNRWLEPIQTTAQSRLGLFPELGEKPPEIHQLELHPQARHVPGGEGLVIERRVGRGRIVMTSFPLNARTFAKGWIAQDTFFNAFLLRRPARRYESGDDLLPRMDWVDLGSIQDDARLNSHLRFFSRDADMPTQFDSNLVMRQAGLSGYQVDNQSGVAGWNDASRCAEMARSALNESAGIEVPRRSLIATMLGVYLVLLVPVNWAVFRLMGRVEWAWGVVPLLAVIATVAVARMAQLDIGFARSRTEIAVLELQPGYNRGHLTRYTGLYTSLATAYRATFDDRFAVASSFPAQRETQTFADRQTLSLQQGQKARLDGLQVASNSTGMFHSEEFVELPDIFTFTRRGPNRYEVTNSTGLDLNQVAVLWRDPQDQLHWAWLDQLDDGLAGTLEFQPAENMAELFPGWSKTALRPGELRIEPLLRLAIHGERLGPDEMIMVGWTGQPIGGAQLQPESSQSQYRTIVVSHLQYGPMPAPRADVNLLRDVAGDESAEPNAIDFSNPGDPAGF